MDDITNSKKLLKMEPANQFLRRTYIRTVFAMIEGHLFRLKQFILELHTSLGSELSTAEKALLAEQSFELNEKGIPTKAQKFIPLTKNVKFTFGLFARVFSSSHLSNFNEDGWNYFQESIRIRNRIVHPKTVNDMIISDNEIQAFDKGRLWYEASVLRGFQSSSLPKQKPDSRK